MGINFSFEYGTRNLVKCPDKNNSGIYRFGVSSFATKFGINHNSVDKPNYLNFDIPDFTIVNADTFDGNYVIPVGVNHSPDEWTGWPFLAHTQHKRRNVLEFLSEKSLKDIREGRAILLLDQSLEGYHNEWLWNWFHQTVDHYKVPNRSIIYVTGNILAKNQYDSWCSDNNTIQKITVIPHTHFEHMIGITAINRGLYLDNPVPTLEDHIRYKIENGPKIKDYNLLQKRRRNHRAWALKTVHDAGLLDCGLITTDKIESKHTHMEGKHITKDEAENILNPHLPRYVNNIPVNLKPDLHYITLLNDDIMLDSWISVVSEASFADADGTCFISEKTFKPIACSHPFIIWGNKNSLHHLRELGYKTFHPYIDETYDILPTFERMGAIGNALKKFHSVEDKSDWYRRISDILLHNLENLRKNTLNLLPKSGIVFNLYVEHYFRKEE